MHSIEECPAGFWDNDCSRMCQHPYFGINCLQTCQCNEHLCDNVEGCPDNSKFFLTIVLLKIVLMNKS